jgi:hypothetical protein
MTSIIDPLCWLLSTASTRTRTFTGKDRHGKQILPADETQSYTTLRQLHGGKCWRRFARLNIGDLIDCSKAYTGA